MEGSNSVLTNKRNKILIIETLSVNLSFWSSMESREAGKLAVSNANETQSSLRLVGTFQLAPLVYVKHWSTRARISAHETIPGQAASSRVMASSIISYPLNRLLGPAVLSKEKYAVF
ncbi:unnamed protein product, partial [Vitis vinifera]|uniref:Uncharacterized protein n=1 Tax=Vitis vinifera TaxID=29760 RepID=D7STE7_VITVI